MPQTQKKRVFDDPMYVCSLSEYIFHQTRPHLQVQLFKSTPHNQGEHGFLETTAVEEPGIKRSYKLSLTLQSSSDKHTNTA